MPAWNCGNLGQNEIFVNSDLQSFSDCLKVVMGFHKKSLQGLVGDLFSIAISPHRSCVVITWEPDLPSSSTISTCENDNLYKRPRPTLMIEGSMGLPHRDVNDDVRR